MAIQEISEELRFGTKNENLKSKNKLFFCVLWGEGAGRTIQLLKKDR